MKRRNFLYQVGMTSAGVLASTSILNSVVFATPGSKKIKHVVLVVLAGGVRRSDVLELEKSSDNVNRFGMLWQQGTLYSNMLYRKGPTSHDCGLETILTGKYSNPHIDTQPRSTIFSMLTSNSSNSAESYFIASKNFDGSSYELPSNSTRLSLAGAIILNFEEENKSKSASSAQQQKLNDFAVLRNATEILKTNQPLLTVLKLHGADVCHSNFTAYSQYLQETGEQLDLFWQTIQSTPELRDETTFIVVPDHGRNNSPNGVKDDFGQDCYDHSASEFGGDQGSRDIFCFVAGPENIIEKGRQVSDECDLTDVANLVLNLLGNERFPDSNLLSTTS